MRKFGFALVALMVIACSSKSGEVTVYPLLCNGLVQNGDCRGHWLLLKRTVYRVSAEDQAVSYWTLRSGVPERKLSKCVVSDTRNWRCSDPDGSAEIRMEAGTFSNHIGNYKGSDVDKDYEARTRYVSWLRYWMAWFDGWMNAPNEY